MAPRDRRSYYREASEGKGPAPQGASRGRKADRAQGLGHRPGKQDQAGAMPLAHRIGVVMPKGPRGEKRPADVIGAAIMVGRIATGEEPDNARPETEPQREGGRKGGEIRAATTPRPHRVAGAKRAAEARWRGAEVAPGKKEPQER
jgi:hypothetical protein